PCRRAAAKSNWVIMVRSGETDQPPKMSLMDHASDFDKVPKPSGIKKKVDRQTGMIRYDNEQQFKEDLKRDKQFREYAEKHGLKLDSRGFLINQDGQRFYSDLDLYDVFDAATGQQVRLGSGRTQEEGLEYRSKLDQLINIMYDLGIDYALIQHGADRQWVKHKPKEERITVFLPDGRVQILPDYAAVSEYIARVQRGEWR
ncbi:hypothetical protein MYX78_13745, partial [Acidobacteria bacterium AH-259-G07]|nr:hypothetical protein [Acidobacteria bacterium AH-259-G07]